MEDLAVRLARLEKSAARWRMAALSLAVLGIAAACLGQGITIRGGAGGGMQAPLVTADKLVANESIILNGSDGKPRIVLSSKDDKPTFELKDKDDHSLLVLSVEKDQAHILIQDAAGKKLYAEP